MVEWIWVNGYEIVVFDEVVDFLKLGYGCNRYVVLIFDDGYWDNIEVVYLILKEMNVFFIIFVVIGLIDCDIELWWIVFEWIIVENDEIVFFEDGVGGGIVCCILVEKFECF